MATLLLSAAGAALGAGFGGTVLGLSGAVIGRAVGASLGRALDQRLMGVGSDAVEVGRTDRFRLTSAGEGAAVPRIWGRMRVAGQVIWATQFMENVQRSGGGKGSPRPSTQQFSYSISVAIALCQGPILRVGRMWADGVEVSPQSFNIRVYTGTETQLPDPRIEAVEGPGQAPAYRGIAYVVIEDLDLTPYGNRLPQFSFEVMARSKSADPEGDDLVAAVRAVALIPGTGEYALATTPVHYSKGPGLNSSANVHSPSGKTDFATSLQHLTEEAPNCAAVSIIVSWFGNDLRCGSCEIKPKVEEMAYDGIEMPWRAGGIDRFAASEVARVAGRSVYGGTPADSAIVEGIQASVAAGKSVMFYPFILMEQLDGNSLPDPYTGQTGQPSLPWRGRITLSVAPDRVGTPNATVEAAQEVDTFFGTAQPGDFAQAAGQIVYSGPTAWGYRRFILHNAHLCAMAGGVGAFCIGSEMRGLTSIRGSGNSFPAVAALRQLAADVRTILGAGTKIGYAADWSEYFGHHVGSDVLFHLDPLWADPNIDFVGIDNYMPVSDWRDGNDHLDVGYESIHNLDYLIANIAGGEGFDWFYDGPEGEAIQRRLPIEDGGYDEAWVYRYKDLKSWWSLPHFDRVGGVKSAIPTAWQPGSKPIWFTEYGCAALDKGTNQPNKFLDPKSSESGLPKFSNGRRDDLIQMQYLRAFHRFWRDEANNPISAVYSGPMVDMGRAHVWAWDTRPFPEFPGQTDVWSDGANYAKGHWLNGRVTNQPLSSVVKDICRDAELDLINVDALQGVVRGFSVAEVQTARASLQPLLTAYGFEPVEREGVITFNMRTGRAKFVVEKDSFAVSPDIEGLCESNRASEAEISGRVRLGYVEAEGNYESSFVEAIFPDESGLSVSQSELPLVLTAGEARAVSERWLSEARVARDSVRFALPLSARAVGAGDVLELAGTSYRIDRVEVSDLLLVDGVRVEDGIYSPSDASEDRIIPRSFVSPVPVFPLFVDLPLMTGKEVPDSPHAAVTANPWPGSVTIWSAPSDEGYEVNKIIAAPSVIGLTETPLAKAQTGVWDNGAPLRVRIMSGAFSSASKSAVLNGANAMAIRDDASGNWEVMQFATAELVGPSTYELSTRLRGQQGTDGIMPDEWPIGSYVVFLDRTVVQLDVGSSSRGLLRFYRTGATARGYDDPNVVLRQEAFEGVGLRPYPVAHIRWRVVSGATLNVSWVRRTRIDGDSWQSTEIPLGEDREAYVVRVIFNDTILQETTVTAPAWTTPFASLAPMAMGSSFTVSVAQLSDRFGPGPFKSITVTL